VPAHHFQRNTHHRAAERKAPFAFLVPQNRFRFFGKKIADGAARFYSRWSQRRSRSSMVIEEATKFIDIDRFCLSPQCGFASAEEGNILAEREQ
jgi:hypothetical protein